MRNLQVHHQQGNPLRLQDLRERIDVGRYKCALVLCDQQWLQAEDRAVAPGGVARGQLRMDSLIMGVQLNIRKLLVVCPAVSLQRLAAMCRAVHAPLHEHRAHAPPQDQGLSDINVICEKVAYEGLTRFEDRRRLPLGISFNLASYSAKLLTQVRVLCHRLLDLHRQS